MISFLTYTHKTLIILVQHMACDHKLIANVSDLASYQKSDQTVSSVDVLLRRVHCKSNLTIRKTEIYSKKLKSIQHHKRRHVELFVPEQASSCWSIA